MNFLINQAWPFVNENLISGIVLTLLLGGAGHLYNKKKKLLCYDFLTQEVICSLEINGLTISYVDGEQSRVIERLMCSCIFIWNEGRSVIKADDIYNNENLLRVIIKGEVIGKVTMPYHSGSVNFGECKIIGQETVIDLKINHLNHGDGFIVKCYHTCQKSRLDESIFRLEAPILDGSDVVREPVYRNPRKRLIVLLVLYSILGFAFWLLWIIGFWFAKQLAPVYGNFVVTHFLDADSKEIYIWLALNIRNFVIGMIRLLFLLPLFWVAKQENLFRLSKKISRVFVKVVDWPGRNSNLG